VTIDEVLLQIEGSQACWIVRHEDTGEIVRVVAFPASPTPEESTACLMSHQDFTIPVCSQFLRTETVTREYLERENAEAETGHRRIVSLRKWARLPGDGPMNLLESPDEYPSILKDADDFLIIHLWRVHRDKVLSRLRARQVGRGH